LKIYADASFLISLYSLDANSAIAGQTIRACSGERYSFDQQQRKLARAVGLKVN
jgi:predicted nucleic acid-binding protein